MDLTPCSDWPPFATHCKCYKNNTQSRWTITSCQMQTNAIRLAASLSAGTIEFRPSWTATDKTSGNTGNRWWVHKTAIKTSSLRNPIRANQAIHLYSWNRCKYKWFSPLCWNCMNMNVFVYSANCGGKIYVSMNLCCTFDLIARVCARSTLFSEG